MYVVAVATLDPSVSAHLVALSDLGDQVPSELSPGAHTGFAEPHRYGESARFPRRAEGHLIFEREPGEQFFVFQDLHACTFTSPTPIIESRVTSSASCSSLI